MTDSSFKLPITFPCLVQCGQKMHHFSINNQNITKMQDIKIKDQTPHCSKHVLAVVLFFSWLKTWIWFYIFNGFRMWNYEQIEFLEKSYFPQNKRDEKLMKKILDFNRKRLKNNG